MSFEEKENKKGLVLKNRDKFGDARLRIATKLNNVKTSKGKEKMRVARPLKPKARLSTRIQPEVKRTEDNTRVQIDKGTVHVKKNWDAYGLPEYLRNTDTQIQMKIRRTPKEEYYKWKGKLKKLEIILDILPYWKGFITISTLVFSIFSVSVISYLVLSTFGRLKPEIPLFYNNQLGYPIQVSKKIFLIVPIATFCFNVVIARLSMMIYRFDKNLVNLVSIILDLINLLMIIAVIQIISLVL